MKTVNETLAGHHYVLVPGAESAAPLVLFHGTGGSEHDLLDLGARLAPGRSLLGVRGNVSEAGAARFFRRLREGVFDEADLHLRTAALHSFLEAAGRKYDWSLSDLTLLGFSNGANIAASYLLRGFPAAGAVLLRPMLPFAPRAEDPPTPAPARVLMLNGGSDPIVPEASRAALVKAFQTRGHAVEAHLLPAGHRLTGHDLELAQAWLEAG